MPYNEFGFTNHYVYPRTSGALSHDQTKTATIDSAIGELERLLNKQIADEVKDKKAEKPDIYKIFIDESFEPKKYPLNIEQLAQAGMIDQSRPIPPFPSKNEFLRFTPSFSLIKILEELMKSHPEMDVASYDQWVTKVKSRATIEAYNSSDNLNSATDMFFRYFRIRSNLIVTKEFDNIRKVNVKIIEYVIEPYLIHAYSLAIPGVQIGNNYKNFVPKKYYYTFTGENRDIQELNINYKVAYYQTRLKDVEAGDTRKTNPKLTEEELSGATLHPLRRREISGEGTSNDDADLPLQSEVGTSKSADAGRTGPGSSRFDHFLDAFTHPQADMVTLDMQILGDPGWLGQSQFLSPEPVASAPNISRDASVTAFRGGDKEFVWNPRLKCYNSELADPIVEMKFKFPTDCLLYTSDAADE